MSLKQQKGTEEKKKGRAAGEKEGGEDREDGNLVYRAVSQTVQHFLCYQLSVWEKSTPPSLLSSGIDKDGPDYSLCTKAR